MKRKIGFYKPTDEFEQKLIAAASSILQHFDPNDHSDYEDILPAVRQVLPTASEGFTVELLKNPKLPITILKDVMTFYISSPLTSEYTTEIGLRTLDDVDENLENLIWLASLYRLPADQPKSVCNYCEQRSNLINSVWLPMETGNHDINSYPLIADGSAQENHYFGNSERNVMFKGHVSHSIIQIPSQTDGNKPRRHLNEHQSYSSVGSIPKLPLSRPNNSNPNVSGLFRAFSHPSSKFQGSGSVIENLGTFHQSYMNICKSFNLTEDEAFSNLYVLFPTNSEAGRYYHKHVANRAKNLEEPFYLLYNRFKSRERRDRLLQKWNNLKFSDFMQVRNATGHNSLSEIC